MEKLTKQYLIDIVCDRWFNTYFNKGMWSYGPNKEVIYNKLVSLGDNKTEADVTRAIGNSSWTSLICSQCDQDNESVITISVVGYNNYLCKECLEKALNMLGE